MSKVGDFLDFWVQNSVQPAEQFGMPGASQDVSDLTGRCLDMAASEGISQEELKAEIGDIAQYIGGKLAKANQRA